MILNTNTKTETNCMLDNKAFSIQASPIAFEILSSRLYSDPKAAVIRELLTNAYDSQVANGNPDTPIKIIVPSYTEQHFVIRDYGTGLSKEDILHLYTTFFDSTKSTSNIFTGCFGLGSKTPFSYTSSFTVTSYYNGIAYRYIAVKKDGYPSIYCVSELPTKEPNGLEISIPISTDDNVVDFREKLITYLQFIPEINVECNISLEIPKPLHTIDNLKIYKLDNYYDRIYIKQGQNVYNLTHKFITHCFHDESLLLLQRDAAKCLTMVIEVPIGILEITPSREQLTFNTKNCNAIKEIITKANSSFITLLMSKEFNDVESYSLNTAKGQVLTEKYLNVPEFKNHGFVIIPDNAKNAQPNAVTWMLSSHSYINSLIGLLINSYEYIRSGYSASKYGVKHYICSGGKTTVILIDDVKMTIIKKLQGIVQNYPEITQKYGNLLVLCKNDLTFIDTDKIANIKSYLQGRRIFRKLINTLNTIPDCNFQVGVTTWSKFSKMYPNQRLARHPKKEVTPKTDKTIWIRSGSIYKNNFKTHDGHFCSLEKIYQTFAPNDTYLIVIDKTESDELTKKLALISILYNVHDKNGKRFVAEYIKEKYDYSENSSQYILCITKSNKRYFKNYTELDLDDIIQYADKQDWALNSFLSETQYVYINKLAKYKSIYEDKNVTFNSPLAKKIDVLHKYVNSINNIHTCFIEYPYNTHAFLATTFVKYINPTHIHNSLTVQNVLKNDDSIKQAIAFVKANEVLIRYNRKYSSNIDKGYWLRREHHTQLLKMLRGY